VVEADLDSGAMGTARWAVEQNRDVFAVPGPIDYPGSRGPHRLIRDGARLVETVEDILAELPPHAGVSRQPAAQGVGAPAQPFSEEERAVLSALDLDPKHIDELVQFCDISPTAILPILLNLEMRGVIVSCGSGSYALASPGAIG
jgi:DNA processing protein